MEIAGYRYLEMDDGRETEESQQEMVVAEKQDQNSERWMVAEKQRQIATYELWVRNRR